MKILLAFGPDSSYFVGTETHWKSRGLGETVSNCLSNVNRVHALALAPDGAFIFCGQNAEGQVFNIEQGMKQRFPRLQRWHQEITKLNPALRIFDVAVGLSSQCNNAKADCFWVASSDSLRWSGVHEDFQWAMQYQLSLAGWHRQPRCAAFGVNRSFVVVWDDGVVNYRLKGYDKLLGILEFQKEVNPKNIAYVALNPYRECEFFIAFKDGSTHWNLPIQWELDVAEVAREYKTCCRRVIAEISNMQAPLFRLPLDTSGGAGGELGRRVTSPAAFMDAPRSFDEILPPHILKAETQMLRPKTREKMKQRWQDVQEQIAGSSRLPRSGNSMDAT